MNSCFKVQYNGSFGISEVTLCHPGARTRLSSSRYLSPVCQLRVAGTLKVHRGAQISDLSTLGSRLVSIGMSVDTDMMHVMYVAKREH